MILIISVLVKPIKKWAMDDKTKIWVGLRTFWTSLTQIHTLEGFFLDESSIITAHLMASMLWWSLWGWRKEKSHTEQNQVNTACSAHPVLLLFRHTQIFDDNLPSTVFFISSWLPVIQKVNWWSTYTSCPTCPTLTSLLFDEGLLLLESSFIFLWPSLNTVLSQYTCWSISSVCDGVFPHQT